MKSSDTADYKSAVRLWRWLAILFCRIEPMIRVTFKRKACATIVCAAWALLGNVSAQTNGIYADFTTSLGNFTCQLHYTNAPRTVANFIGLTTGELAWLDLNTGVSRNVPFYDGLTFHRVI